MAGDADDLDLEVPKKKPLVLILIITNVVVIGGAVAAFLLFGGGGGGDEAQAAEEGGEEPAASTTSSEEPGPMINLPPFVVNLSDEERAHYLKVAVSLELRDEAAKLRFEPRKTHARHAILMTLGALTLEETRDVDDRERLRGRLLSELEKVLGPRTVREVLFTDFVTQ
jgi:flagellar protein FliL